MSGAPVSYRVEDDRVTIEQDRDLARLVCSAATTGLRDRIAVYAGRMSKAKASYWEAAGAR